MAQEPILDSAPRQVPEKIMAENGALYCAIRKNGHLVIMEGAKQIKSDVELSDGMVLKVDNAIVERRDGSLAFLRNGECVNNDGVIVPNKKIRKPKTKILPQ